MKQKSKAANAVLSLISIGIIAGIICAILQFRQNADKNKTAMPSGVCDIATNESQSNFEQSVSISEYVGTLGESICDSSNSEADIDQTLAQEKPTIRQTTYKRIDGSTFVRLVSGAQVENRTSETNQYIYAQSNLKPDFTISLDGSPQVLILHTHTTEGYELAETDCYDTEQNARTTDEHANVIAVGDEIALQLENAGIGVIHDATYYDCPSNTGCYQRSAQSAKSIISQYPTIKVVLDIHRDSITAADGTRIAPIVEIDNQKAAQAKIIVGCDDGTMNMPDCKQNLRLACLIQNTAEYAYPYLMRAIEFDYCKYNQDISTGSLTIEVGSAANSLEQACCTGRLLGASIAQALLSISS